MDRIIKPEIYRIKASKLAQRSFDPPGCHAVCLLFGGSDLCVNGAQVCKPQVFLCKSQHSVAAECIVRTIDIGVTALVQHGSEDLACCLGAQLLPDSLGRDQFGHVQHSIRVTGKHTGAGRSIHAAFAALGTLGVVVTVDHGAIQRSTDKVELVAKLRHLICTVLVTRNDFVDRVKDNRGIPFFLRPADQFWGKLVHRHRCATQVPDVDVRQVVRRITQGCVYIFEAVQAGCPVQLQVDVQHFALRTGELTQPRSALGQRDA